MPGWATSTPSSPIRRRHDIAWRYGIGPDMLDRTLRLKEIANFVEQRVRPARPRAAAAGQTLSGPGPGRDRPDSATARLSSPTRRNRALRSVASNGDLAMRPFAATILAFTLAPTAAPKRSRPPTSPSPSQIDAVTALSRRRDRHPDDRLRCCRQGDTTLVASDLPTSLDPASIRLDAAAAPGIAVAGVDTRIVHRRARRARRDPRGPKLEVAARPDAPRLTHSLRPSSVKKGFIERVALSDRAPAAARRREARPDPDALRTAWNAVGDDLAAVNEAMRLAEIKARGIDREPSPGSRPQLEGRPQGEERTELRIAFSSGAPLRGHILVSYVVGQASLDSPSTTRVSTRRKGPSRSSAAPASRQPPARTGSDVALTVSDGPRPCRRRRAASRRR